MNRNTTALLLVVLAIGIYFSFTRGQLTRNKAIKAVNDEYSSAIRNAQELIRIRDEVLNQYKAISAEDQVRLDKMIPSTVDNIRLIIDLKNIALRHGFSLKNIKATASPTTPGAGPGAIAGVGGGPSKVAGLGNPSLDTVSVSFTASAPYLQYLSFLQDVEASLRIMDVTRLGVKAEDSGIYEFTTELKTYWLRQ
jgi:hypothetical protein